MKIEGGHELEGEVTISGAKNATVALIPAAVLANGPVTIVGIPQIADVESLADILRLLNVDVTEVSHDHLIWTMTLSPSSEHPITSWALCLANTDMSVSACRAAAISAPVRSICI